MRLKSVEELYQEFSAHFPVEKMPNGKLFKAVMELGFKSGILSMHKQMWLAQTEASDLDRERFTNAVHEEIKGFDKSMRENPLKMLNGMLGL